MKTIRILIGLVASLALGPVVASGIESNIWTLGNVIFDDGGKAKGSFVFSSESGQCEAVNVTVSGPLFNGADFTFASYKDRISCNANYLDACEGECPNGSRYFRLTFDNALGSNVIETKVATGSVESGTYYGKGAFANAKGGKEGLVQIVPTNIDYGMYFDADIRDAEFCQLSVDSGRLSFGDGVTNPAMTCPDLFSWYLFTKVIDDEFWVKWADETQNWPENPLPLCSSENSTDCCNPNQVVNQDSAHFKNCPYFPGEEQQALIEKAKHATNATSANSSSVQSFVENFESLIKVGNPVIKEKRDQIVTYLANECTSAEIDTILPNDPESIGRVLRQTNAEVTIRNQQFHEYLYRNNLYNSDGVLAVYSRNDANQVNNAPYHLGNQSAANSASSKLATVDLPPQSIMIKSNWLSEKLISAMRAKYPEQMVDFAASDQYIRQIHKTPVTLKSGKNCHITDNHLLMAFHVSSKDIPRWVWTTFEHKNNPGRCDFTGCNDSFGYRAIRPVTGESTNYISPWQKSDNLAQSSVVFARDLQYPEGKPTEQLTVLLSHFGIATQSKPQAVSVLPSKSDFAWKNYRLKGSQVNFTDNQGRPTHLGNSITEAGFMSNSSCIGCHARAGVALIEATKAGERDKANFFHLGVFEPTFSEFGYQQSHDGIPNQKWYYQDNGNQSLEVLQTDFVWGFLNAQPLCFGDCNQQLN
ncbi:hypothetical protein [Vibrio cionasavignyae]|uniref:hypothetical protein n=1 Tax=Vibrio cionasavignyae TaxID=2910252 RepID=UPI003D12C8BA